MTKAKGAPKKTVLFGIGAAIILLLLTLVIYQVDSTEYAVVTQFGQPVRVVEDAGLKIKLPDPIQSVQRLDKRVQVYQTSSIELLTLDRLNVSLDYYGTWKIVDPILFLQTVRDNIGAEARLLDVFSSSLSVQLGQYKLEQLVNTDAEKLELDTMIADTVAYAKERAAEYGIEVVDAQIRVLNFPEANKQSVYDRMSAEREQMAQRYRSEGSEEASNIRANAEKEQQLILAEAYQKVQEIMGEGDAEAIRIYGEAFQKDPEFYEFIRTLETYEKTIDGNTTLILPSTSEILKYLGGSGDQQGEQSMQKFSLDQLRETVNRFFLRLAAIPQGSGKGGKKEGSVRNDLKNAFRHINPKKAGLGVLGGVIAVYLLSGIYVVNPGEQAVVRRFGAVLDQTVTEGLHYRLPWPVDKVQTVNVSEVRRADIGMTLPEHIHQPDDEPQAIQLLTADENIITTQAIVHYRVSNAAKFLYNVNGNSEQLVRYSVEAALVQLMASVPVDNILSTDKVAAQNGVMELAQEALDRYDAGIQITAFNIQNVVPPDPVSSAFLDVTNAMSERETSINEANGYYNSLIPQARAEANRMISNAEAYKQEQVSRATGDTEKFLSMLKEYQSNSSIYTADTTKYRLLLETLDKILPTVKLYIVDSSDGSVDVKLFDPSISGAAITANSQG